MYVFVCVKVTESISFIDQLRKTRDFPDFHFKGKKARIIARSDTLILMTEITLNIKACTFKNMYTSMNYTSIRQRR